MANGASRASGWRQRLWWRPGLVLLVLAAMSGLALTGLRAQTPSGTAQQPLADPGSQRHLVLEIQLALTELGYDPGAIDGVLSGATKGAILWFQTDRDLPRDGQATPSLLADLRAAQGRQVATPQPLLTAPGEAAPGGDDSVGEPAKDEDFPWREDEPGRAAESDAGLPLDRGTVASHQPVQVAGPAEVVDTARVVVDGWSLRLNGIFAESRPDLVQSMQAYLRSQGGGLTCEIVEQGYRCLTGHGYDLAEAALFNGAARAAPGAPDPYLRAEANAQAQRLGLWR